MPRFCIGFETQFGSRVYDRKRRQIYLRKKTIAIVFVSFTNFNSYNSQDTPSHSNFLRKLQVLTIF